MNEEEKEKPWADYGDYGADEDFFLGNKEGLKKFRDAIDEAIESGESLIKEDYTEIAGIKVVDKKNGDSKTTIGEKLALWGFLALAIFCVFVFIFGLTQLGTLFD